MFDIPQGSKWKIKFFEIGDHSPIHQFVDNCSPVQRRKISTQLHYVAEFGLTSCIPNLKKMIGTPFWELRILGKDNIRIICLAIVNNTIIVLHVFFKKKQKTPLKELEIVYERYKKFMT